MYHPQRESWAGSERLGGRQSLPDRHQCRHRHRHWRHRSLIRGSRHHKSFERCSLVEKQLSRLPLLGGTTLELFLFSLQSLLSDFTFCSVVGDEPPDESVPHPEMIVYKEIKKVSFRVLNAN